MPGPTDDDQEPVEVPPAAERELFAAVSGIVDGLRRVHADAVALYTLEIEDILRSRSRHVDRIDHVLDRLVSFCGDDAALVLFKRLCRYYWDIDPQATARHVNAYREWFEPEEGDGDAVKGGVMSSG